MPRIDLGSETGRVEALRTMVMIRKFEDEVSERFADNEIPGFVHLSQGQEAVAVGTCGATENGDYVTSTHRGHGHAIAMGMDPDRLLAELYGKAAGYCEGRGGSMHVADTDRGMLGAQPIVGESIPLATGAAITSQVGDEDWIAIGFTGDGAVAAGQVHEAFNLAAVWDLPVVFVVENNQYSEGMTFEEQHNVEDLADMAAGYGIPGEVVDGQDVEAVFEAVRSARDRAAAGEGPTIVEAKTYRFRGHFEGDEEPYRSQQEVDRWKQARDPIENFAGRLTETGEINDRDLAGFEEAAEKRIGEAVTFARDADPPSPNDAYEDIFVDSPTEIDRFRRLLSSQHALIGDRR